MSDLEKQPIRLSQRDLAPICAFGYNRPDHLRDTLEALSRNPEAKDSTLYLFLDGPRPDASENDCARIEATRKVAREKTWCGTVILQESNSNRGLAESIVSGIGKVIERHGRVIVLEDDLLTSPGFLRYMNEALDLYENEERVYQISGFMYPNRRWAPKTGFLRTPTSWGWATWERAWSAYETDAKLLREAVDRENRRQEFDLDGTSFYYEELHRNETGELKTWAVKWYASLFLRHGLCLYPRRSLIRNTGFDGSGIHCESDNSGYFDRLPIVKSLVPRRIEIKEDPVYLRAAQRSFRHRLKIWTGATWRERFVKKFRRLRNA